MWIPKTENEIVQAIHAGTLQETAIFDAKRELPHKSKDLAKDIAAMSTNGGTLLFGVAEDHNHHLTQLTPIDLAGEKERITNIIQTSIAEPPEVFIHIIPTSANPAKGYLVIAIPPSSRAPHMVIIGNDNRYYGRGAAGNVPLTEGEVARLYERRQRWNIDMHALLDDAIKNRPLKAHSDFAYLHLIIRPVGTTNDLLHRACKNEDIKTYLHTRTHRALNKDIFPLHRFSPDFRDRSTWYKQVNGWITEFEDTSHQQSQRDPSRVLDLRIDTNGSGSLFCGRVAHRRDSHLLLFESMLAGLTARFLWTFGELYNHAHYVGPVNVGIAVTGIQGAIPSVHGQLVFLLEMRPFEQDSYRHTEQVLAPRLSTETQEVSEKLVLPLIQTVTQGEYNPFKNRS